MTAVLDSWGRADVRVRMYRDILGDCFLLAFPNGGGVTHMLIDSGILQGMDGAQARARRIMIDIASETNGLIDILVVTHEHYDHLSCFSLAKDVFEGIKVGELWFAWTEDPRNEMAQVLRARRSHALDLLDRSHDALVRLQVDGSEPNDDDDDMEQRGASRERARLDRLRNLLAFNGRDPKTGAPPRRGDGTGDILEQLRVKADKVRYLSPGQGVIRHDALPGVSIYVLGPPMDGSQLRRSRPSKRGGEVYRLGPVPAGGQSQEERLASKVLEEGQHVDSRELPFDMKFFVGSDFDDAGPDGSLNVELARYRQAENEWRRIDRDWFGATEQLALKLDSDTNNTSLVMAMELGDADDAKVLLFPGDAQVGSWLSWSDHSWPRSDRPGIVTAEGLLSRTVLYKVSHHGSHNATLRERGLELMGDRDLVAMVPVHEQFATLTKHWSMPFPSLFKRLVERTGGRVLRADQGLAALHAGRQGGEGLNSPEWDAFIGTVREVSDGEGVIAWEHRVTMERR